MGIDAELGENGAAVLSSELPILGVADANLNNNRYKGGETGETVGDTERCAENNGLPKERKDVSSTAGRATTARAIASRRAATR